MRLFNRTLAFMSFALIGFLPAQKVVLKGSDTLGAKLVPKLSEAFKAQNPGVSFEITAEGSSAGIAAVSDAAADIGMSSRRAKPSELANASGKGVTLKPTIVCYDAIGVIVNASNPVSNLTKKEIEEIFTGGIADWSGAGGSAGAITVYTRSPSSGTYGDFKDLAMKKRDYAGSSQKFEHSEEIAKAVAGNKNGIGYVGVGYAKGAGVKLLTIDGTEANAANILNKSYPYARPTFFYTNGEPQGVAAKFISFILSPAANGIITELGFFPSK